MNLAISGVHTVFIPSATNHSFVASKLIREIARLGGDVHTMVPPPVAKRIEHVVQSCFNGKRIVVFSGGESKSLDGLYEEIRGLRDGGANGSIIGRNTFQRPREEALAMLEQIVRIYKGRE